MRCLCCFGNSAPTIAGCVITANMSVNEGGGIYSSFSSPTIVNCVISGNKAWFKGGGLYSWCSPTTLINCTVANNWSDYDGAGMFCYYSDPVMTSCILWSDDPDEVATDHGYPQVNYCDIRNGWSGVNNLDLDPCFVDPENNDFRLAAHSPCIDAGDPHARLDLNESRNDMGAYGGLGDLVLGVIGGVISGTLSMEGSTYIVGESLIVEKGDTLVIEPGVTIRLHNHSGILIHGHLRAVGTSEQPITVTRLERWDSGNGLRFIGGSGELAFCTIEFCLGAYGGGVSCDHSAASFRNCTFSNNRAQKEGGAIYCMDSSPVIEDCTIWDNWTTYLYGGGGGISCDESSPLISRCFIGACIADFFGGGISCYSNSSPRIIDCTIAEKESEKGAGISCYFGSSPAIIGCTIDENAGMYDWSHGGGIYCHESSPVIENCVITRNSAWCRGGGISCFKCSPVAPTFTNCIISENEICGDGDSGAGIWCLESDPNFVNCTIADNWAPQTGSVLGCWKSSPVLTNCILWRNHPGDISLDESDPVITYSDIEGGWVGEGNINENPRFAPFPIHGFEYLLRPGSPCIDTGDPTIEDGLYDWHPLWPEWYPDGARSDMGAYGGQGNVQWFR